MVRQKTSYFAIGLMSGTSMDGIDAALLKTDGIKDIVQLNHVSFSYDNATKCLFKMAEYIVRHHFGDMQAVQQHFQEEAFKYLRVGLGLSENLVTTTYQKLQKYLYGEEGRPFLFNDIVALSEKYHGDVVLRLLKDSGYKDSDIDVIGYHGQTLFHKPEQGISIILGDGQELATRLNVPVINNFRAADVAAGGKGAPFAPLYHQALAVRDKILPSVIVNCGGISNITIIPDAAPEKLIAFDTGPGNGLVDRFVRERTYGEVSMDKDGQYGLKGVVHKKVLKALYASALIKNQENYFDKRPPKCLDIGDMTFCPEMATLSLEDGAATLEAFTADTIVESLDLVDVPRPKNWILAGGGWYNPVIYQEFVSRLKAKIPDDIVISHADDIGWRNQALEAEIFAFLAVRSLKGLPLSVPGTTGVPQPMEGGTLWMPKS